MISIIEPYTKSVTPSLPESIMSWIVNNITTPIKGFDHKRNPDGSFFSIEQQLHQTRLQVVAVASYFYHRGRSTTEVMDIITSFQEED